MQGVVRPQTSTRQGATVAATNGASAKAPTGARRKLLLAAGGAFLVGGVIIGGLIWLLALRSTSTPTAIPSAPVPVATEVPTVPSSTPTPELSESSASDTESSASPTSAVSETAESGATSPSPLSSSEAPDIRALPAITDVEFSPDYVVIRGYELFGDGSAILTYDRLSPGDNPGSSRCRALDWSLGKRCVTNVNPRTRAVGVLPGSFIVAPNGGLYTVGQRELDALLSPEGTPLSSSMIVALVVDSSGLVRELRIAAEADA